MPKLGQNVADFCPTREMVTSFVMTLIILGSGLFKIIIFGNYDKILFFLWFQKRLSLILDLQVQ